LNHAIASDAAIYIFILLPSLWAFAIFRVQQKYLHAQNIMYPSTIILGIGNAFNYLFNYIFMYSIDMGYKGCALSTSLTKIIMLILMSLYLVSLTDKSFQKKFLINKFFLYICMYVCMYVI
jgi:MATE family multidrug resistance protein